MARSTDEIQADIALTREVIERQLDHLTQKLPHKSWTPYAAVGAALVVGLVLSRVPLLSLLNGSARALRTGLTVASAVAAVDRFVAERRAA